MNRPDFSGLTRKINTMPDYIEEALESSGLMEAYKNRPPYQQNDYLGWICRAKRKETRNKRLTQMLDELEKGNVYMNMKYNPPGDSTQI